MLLAALITPYAGYAGDCCPEPDITLFFTSDTRGMLRRCGCSEGQMGGISARASYIKNNGQKSRTLVLDAGDTFFEGLETLPDRKEFYAIKAATIADAMRVTGYNAAAVGEYDLAYGPEFLKDAAKDAGFPFLSANAAWDAAMPFEGRTVVSVGGFKVGVVAVLDAEFPYKDFKENFGPISVSDPLKAANSEIAALGDNVDLVVVLSHLSIEPVEDFVRGLKGADIVIQGHSSEHMEAPVMVGDTILLKGYTMAKYMGRMDLWLDHNKDDEQRRTAVRVPSFEFSVAALDEGITPDPEVEGIISGYREKLNARKFVFEKPEPEGEGEFVGPEKCRQCHADDYLNWSMTRHAHAFPSLVNTSDQYDPECLPCHTTGFGYMTGYRTGGDDTDLINVTCESCHGRGAGHVAEKSGASDNLYKDVITREVPEEICRGCHDEPNSPNFYYEDYLDMGGAHRVSE